MLTLALVVQLALCLPEAPDVRVMHQGEQSFVCFTPEDAQKLLQLRLDFPLLKLKSEKLEESNLIRDMEIRKLTNSVEDISEKLIEQQALVKQLDAEVNKKPAWYKHPVFWAFAGITIGVATYYLIDKNTEHVQDVVLVQRPQK
jgi:hypothetical protein